MTTHANTLNQVPTAWQQLKAGALSVETIRQVDRTAIERFGMHSLVLMENAALGCARWLTERYVAPRTQVMCGRGNNGGDGLAIARHLRLAGWPCHVIQLGPIDQLSSDARANWNILTAKQVTDSTVWEQGRETLPSDSVAKQLSQAELIVDALLGSGAQGNPRQPMDSWIELANCSPAQRIAIDIPSGLDATTGQPAPTTFQAHATLTFVARKVGFAAPEAQPYLGHVEVLPIGIPVELIEELLPLTIP